MYNTKKGLQTKAQKRFTEICNLLAQGSSFKAQKLAEKFECSRKTVSNDLKPLVQSGVVLYEAHHYTMSAKHRSKYKKQQSEILNSMMQAMLEKVMPQHSPNNESLFYFDFEIEEIENEAIFMAISSAISQKLAITFTYTNKNNIASLKTLYPLKISNFSGAWYLSAYDLKKESIRIYYLQSIQEVSHCEEDFLSLKEINDLKDKVDKINSPWFCETKKSVLLYVKDIAILYIKRRKYRNIEICEEKDDTLIVKMYYYQDIEVLNFVKSWLPFIVIKENKLLQSQFQKILTEAQSQY